MQPLYTSQHVRDAEAPLLAAGQGRELMLKAATGLAHVVVRELRNRHGNVYGTRAVALVGSGNNGGDALYALAFLARRGVRCQAVTVAQSAHEEGLAAAVAAGVRVTSEWDGALEADVVIDGILGTGASGALREPLASQLTAWQNEACDQLCIAVDAPTGVNASTGEVDPHAVRATHTVTFGMLKAGLFVQPGAAYCGQVECVDIGLTSTDAPAGYLHTTARVPAPEESDHKYSRGVLGVAAGSRQYPGAAVLTSLSAQNTGVGMVRYVGDAAGLVMHSVPEVVAGRGRVQAWVVGPGAPDAELVDAVLDEAYENSLPAVIDAGALARVNKVRDNWVLTPHAGEAQALCESRGWTVTREEIESAPAHWARRLASELGCCVLLKGARTVISEPDGTVHATPVGPARLATAGSGDVLAGIMGALMATEQPGSSRSVAVVAANAVLIHHAAAGTRALETAQTILEVARSHKEDS